MDLMKPIATIENICKEAEEFSLMTRHREESALFGVTDGKAVGTHIESKFKAYLTDKYTLQVGNAASGIDLPELNIDLKITSATQPQSSCPFRSARQKVFGLGYHLLIFVYEKEDNHKTQTARLNITQTIFIESNRTADYQTTTGIQQILENKGNQDDILAFFQERHLPMDDIEAHAIAEELLAMRAITIGYLTISNALQWRLQYTRALVNAGSTDGIRRILG
jgi:hypothetical protein